MYGGEERRLLSAPHRVRFAGFVATTPALQQMGWQLSAEQDFAGMGVRLAMRHEDAQIIAIKNKVDFYRFLQANHPSHIHRSLSGTDEDYFLTFDVVRIGNLNSMVEYWSLGDDDRNPYGAFRPIDAKTQYVNHRVDKFEDLIIFAPALVETQELIVDPGDVSAILEKIRAAQVPEQEAIRQRKRLRESREGMMLEAEPRRAFHAQILSIAA
jgi:hypothetical protein